MKFLALSLLAAGLSSAAFAASSRTLGTNETGETVCGYTFTASKNGPLTMAVCSGDLDLVKQLTAISGVNVTDLQGLSPLEVAFSSSVVYWQPVPPELYPTIDYLLSAGADANIQIKSQNNATPLSIAALMGNADLAQSLISHGADVSLANSNGNTPMHEAAFCDFRLGSDQGSVAVIKLLVASGADVQAKNSAGQTPFQSVTTPCSFAPDQCTDKALASSDPWPTGSCKQTYLLLRAASN